MDSTNSIVKNTLALYIRMLFSVCVNLYVSRVTLDVLGIEDFGIYNVVGGIVIMLGFINSSMSVATSRFLSIAIGDGEFEYIRKIYNTAILIHRIIAFFILVLCEALGVWLVNYYLNIAEDRIIVANWLFQCSIGITVMGILQVPFSAMIISMEKMDVYAGIEIFNNLLKLAIVLVLGHIIYDRLLFYGLFLLLVSIFVFMMYWLYHHKMYKQYMLSSLYDWKIIKPMLSFSGWDMLGCGGVSLQLQGRQILINKFFSVAMNAANGIALTVGSTLSVFTNNIIMAFRPRIMKCYSVGDMDKMSMYYEYAMIISLFLMNLVMVPLLLNLDFILSIWLVEIPSYTLELCRLTMIIGYVEVINTIVKIGIHASGRMRCFTIFSFSVNCLMVFLTYAFFYNNFSVYSTYYIAFFLTIVNVIWNYILLFVFVPKLKRGKIILFNIFGVIICAIGYILCVCLKGFNIEVSWMRFVIDVLLNGFVLLSFSYLLFKKEIKLLLSTRK